jgi:P pilus assembly chaperone PapD
MKGIRNMYINRLSVIVKRRLIVKSVFLVLALMSGLVSLHLSALGVSTFRIFLDNNQSEQNFLVYSRDPYSQECTLWSRHYAIEPDSSIKAYPDDFIPENSAEKWIRYSPKKFVLEPGTSQTVRFKLRRRPNAEVAEFRSYLAIDCIFDKSQISKNNDSQTQLSPRLRHNVPIIVRTGMLEATVSFVDVMLEDSIVSVTVLKEGARSVFGRLELIDNRSDDVVDSIPQFTIYTEIQKRTANLNTNGITSEYLSLRFVEEKEFGGNINFTQELQ